MLSSLLDADSSSLLPFWSSRVKRTLSFAPHRWMELIGIAWKFSHGLRLLKHSSPLIGLSLGFVMHVFHFTICQQQILRS